MRQTRHSRTGSAMRIIELLLIILILAIVLEFLLIRANLPSPEMAATPRVEPAPAPTQPASPPPVMQPMPAPRNPNQPARQPVPQRGAPAANPAPAAPQASASSSTRPPLLSFHYLRQYTIGVVFSQGDSSGGGDGDQAPDASGAPNPPGGPSVSPPDRSTNGMTMDEYFQRQEEERQAAQRAEEERRREEERRQAEIEAERDALPDPGTPPVGENFRLSIP